MAGDLPSGGSEVRSNPAKDVDPPRAARRYFLPGSDAGRQRPDVAALNVLSEGVRRELLAQGVSAGFVTPRPRETAGETLARQRYIAAEIDRRIAMKINLPGYARLSPAHRIEVLQKEVQRAYTNARYLSGKLAAYRLEHGKLFQRPPRR